MSVEQFAQAADTVTRPNLLILNVDSFENPANAFTSIRELRQIAPGMRWLFLARQGSGELCKRVVEAGVDALLQEDCSAAVLQLVTELVLLGQSFMPTDIAELLGHSASRDGSAIIDTSRHTGRDGIGHPHAAGEHDGKATPTHVPRLKIALSERESQILQCLVAGHSNKLVARELGIAEATVKAHVKALLRKMQVSNRTQAAISGLRLLRSNGLDDARRLPRDPAAPPCSLM